MSVKQLSSNVSALRIAIAIRCSIRFRGVFGAESEVRAKRLRQSLCSEKQIGKQESRTIVLNRSCADKSQSRIGRRWIRLDATIVFAARKHKDREKGVSE
jgi:hypothetical protein